MNIFDFKTKEDLLSNYGKQVLLLRWKRFAKMVNSGQQLPMDKTDFVVYKFPKRLLERNGCSYTLYPSLTQRMNGVSK